MAQDLETCRLHGSSEQGSVGVQLGDQRTAFVQQFVGFEGGTHNRGGDGIGEKVGAGSISEYIDHFAAGCNETTRCSSHGFTECGTDEVNLTVQAEQLGSALACLADEASSVTFIDINISVVFLGQFINLIEGSDVSIHREDTVSDNDSHTCLLCLFELFFEVCHVQVLEAVLLSLAETDSIDDRGVVEGVTDYCVFGPEDGLEEASVGIEAAGEEDRVLYRVVISNNSLELFVDILGSTDKPHRTHTETVRVESAFGGLDESGVVGEAEIVVGTEVEDGLSIGCNFGQLWGGDYPFGLVCPCILHSLDLLGEVLLNKLDDLSAHLQQSKVIINISRLAYNLEKNYQLSKQMSKKKILMWGLERQSECILQINKTMNITGRIETPQQILNHPANTSSAKYHWSFSKASRFANPKSYTATISYNLPSSVSKRKSGIGYGDRSKNFEGSSVTPSPCKYQSHSDFSNKEHRGHSFGANRDDLKYANYLKQMEHTPSAYGLNESQVRTTRSYSMRPKTAYPKNYFIPNNEESNRLKEFPGPGKYESIDMMGSGKNFYNSKYKTQKQKSFNGGDRFHNQKQTPGPSDYTITNTIEPDGIYFLSNMKSSGRRPILAQKRELQMAGNKYTPGPVYQKPSDFGHYDRPANQRPRTARN